MFQLKAFLAFLPHFLEEIGLQLGAVLSCCGGVDQEEVEGGVHVRVRLRGESGGLVSVSTRGLLCWS